MNVFVNCLITLLVIISDEKITCKSISDNAISAAAVTKNKKCIEFSTNNDPITAIKAPSEQIHNDIIMFEPRKKKDDVMSKILPMLVMPFIASTILLPMMLLSMKFMLFQSMTLGKLAIFFAIFNMLKNISKDSSGSGLYSHNINIPHHHNHHGDLTKQNYGYTASRK